MLQAEVLFSSELEHCPKNDSEQHKCVGRVNFYAYLHVWGYVFTGWSSPTGTSGSPPAPLIPQWIQKDVKILPQKLTIPFKIDFAAIGGVTDDEVLKCMNPLGQPRGAQPVTYRDNLVFNQPLTIEFTRPTLPVVTPYEEKDDCLTGVAKFMWQSARIPIGGGGSGTVTGPSVIPTGNRVGLTTTASASGGVGGTPYALNVSFSICYEDGCRLTKIPSDTATDAKQIFLSGGAP